MATRTARHSGALIAAVLSILIIAFLVSGLTSVGAAPTTTDTEVKNDAGNPLRVGDGGGSLTVDGSVGIDPASNTIQDGSPTVLLYKADITLYATNNDTPRLDATGLKTIRVFVHDLDCASQLPSVTVLGGDASTQMPLETVPSIFGSGPDWTTTYELPGTRFSMRFPSIGLGECREPGTVSVAIYGRAN